MGWLFLLLILAHDTACTNVGATFTTPVGVSRPRTPTGVVNVAPTLVLCLCVRCNKKAEIVIIFIRNKFTVGQKLTPERAGVSKMEIK